MAQFLSLHGVSKNDDCRASLATAIHNVLSFQLFLSKSLCILYNQSAQSRPGGCCSFFFALAPCGRGSGRGVNRGKSELRRAGCWITSRGADPTESAAEKRPPAMPFFPYFLAVCGIVSGEGAQARVKRRGKSSPPGRRRPGHGKPHPEQGQIGGRQGLPARCPRVRPLEAWSNPGPRGMAAVRGLMLRIQNSAYRTALGCFYLIFQWITW